MTSDARELARTAERIRELEAALRPFVRDGDNAARIRTVSHGVMRGSLVTDAEYAAARAALATSAPAAAERIGDFYEPIEEPKRDPYDPGPQCECRHYRSDHSDGTCSVEECPCTEWDPRIDWSVAERLSALSMREMAPDPDSLRVTEAEGARAEAFIAAPESVAPSGSLSSAELEARLREIEGRLSAATPAPWALDESEEGRTDGGLPAAVRAPKAEGDEFRPGRFVCNTNATWLASDDESIDAANAALIAAAPADLAFLISAIRTLAAERDEAVETLNEQLQIQREFGEENHALRADLQAARTEINRLHSMVITERDEAARELAAAREERDAAQWRSEHHDIEASGLARLHSAAVDERDALRADLQAAGDVIVEKQKLIGKQQRAYAASAGVTEKLREEIERLKVALCDAQSDANYCELSRLRTELQAKNQYAERVAQLTAHRACGSEEHDPANGKLHGCCVVCLVPWPCEVAR